MRALITGASGWIGYTLVREWAKRYGKQSLQLVIPPTPMRELERKRADALKRDSFDIIVHDLIDENFPTDLVCDFDVLFHLAGYTRTEQKNPAIRVNDEGTKNILNALGNKLKDHRVFYAATLSSLDLFDCPNGADESQQCKPLTAYGQTKLHGENFVKELSQKFGYDWTTLRLPTVYGPGYRPGGLFGTIEKKHPFTRIGWPGKLSLIYVDDLMEIMIRLCEKNVGQNELFHIADPTPVRFPEILGTKFQIPLPIFLGRIIQKMALAIVHKTNLPHIVKISSWRLCHLIGNSMVFNSSKINRLIPMEYINVQDGLYRTYHNNVPGID